MEVTNITDLLSIIVAILAIIGGILGIIKFCEARKKEKEPFFRNSFFRAKNSLFPEIEKFIKYSREIRGEILPLSVDNIVGNFPSQILRRAALSHVKDQERIILTKRTKLLWEYQHKDEFQNIKKSLNDYKFEYDRRFKKSIFKIFEKGILLLSTIDNYNNTIYIHVKWNSKDWTDWTTSTQPQLSEQLKKLREKSEWKFFNEDVPPKLKNEIQEIRRKILKLTETIERYGNEFEERIHFWLLIYDNSSNNK